MVERVDVDVALGELAAGTGRLADAQARQDLLVAQARSAGATWAQIAAALGVTVQAAHKRFRDLRADPAAGTSWRERPLPL